MFGSLRKLRLGTVGLVTGVILLGGTTIAAAAPAHKGGGHDYGSQVVTSVNGVSTAGTCGVNGAGGSFTIVGEQLQILTVDVSTTTAFTDAADPSPSFADICVGTHVKVGGTFSSGTVTASSVAVIPPKPVFGKGVVTSVNGVSTAGTCGSAATSGSFTYVGKHLHIVTVDVTSTTAFSDLADTSPSFADVCVASKIVASGTFSSGALNATSVAVAAPKKGHAEGIVTSVNGTSTAGTCGTSGAAGNFTLVPRKHSSILTVNVTSTTAFTNPSDPTPSFADVCVGNHVKALGTFSSGGLAATSVAVLPPGIAHVLGIVTSVNGVPTAGTCGTSAPGAFTVVGNWHHGIITVDVTSTTKFVDVADPTPSFADICVGVHVGALGTFSAGTPTAIGVAVLPAHAGQHGHHSHHGRRH